MARSALACTCAADRPASSTAFSRRLRSSSLRATQSTSVRTFSSFSSRSTSRASIRITRSAHEARAEAASCSNASRWSLSNACSDCKVVCQVRLSSAAFASSPRNRAASSSSSVARLERSAFRASRSLRTLSAFAASISRDSSRPVSSPKRRAFSSAWVRLASSFSWRDCSRASSSISRDRMAWLRSLCAASRLSFSWAKRS